MEKEGGGGGYIQTLEKTARHQSFDPIGRRRLVLQHSRRQIKLFHKRSLDFLNGLQALGRARDVNGDVAV